jgi:hypothetical protein
MRIAITRDGAIKIAACAGIVVAAGSISYARMQHTRIHVTETKNAEAPKVDVQADPPASVNVEHNGSSSTVKIDQPDSGSSHVESHTTVTGNGAGGGVSVNQSTHQSATSGDATSSDGSASTGTVHNSSNSSTTINFSD